MAAARRASCAKKVVCDDSHARFPDIAPLNLSPPERMRQMCAPPFRHGMSRDAIRWWPLVARQMLRTKQPIQQRNVHGEVDVNGFDCMVPVMPPWCCDHAVKPAETKAHVGVDEYRMETHENEVGVQCTLRKPQQKHRY